MDPILSTLAALAREERRSGAPGLRAAEIFTLTFLSLAFEHEAREWGRENSVQMTGVGFACRPDLRI